MSCFITAVVGGSRLVGSVKTRGSMDYYFRVLVSEEGRVVKSGKRGTWSQLDSFGSIFKDGRD